MSCLSAGNPKGNIINTIANLATKTILKLKHICDKAF